MEITNPKHKTTTIYNWKNYGIIHDDFDTLYNTYINTFNCDACGYKFENKRQRHLDHDHDTGLIRKIVCNKCNAYDNYINYPDGYTEKKYREKNKERIKDYNSQYRILNKDKLKEKNKEYVEKNKEAIREKRHKKTECDCGGHYIMSSKARHYNTKRHTLYNDKS